MDAWLPRALLLLWGCAPQPVPSPPNEPTPLRIVTIHVGQGDATLLVGADGSALLIDGGPSRHVDALRAAIESNTGGRLDHVVVTHLDADHLGGVAELLLGPDHIAHSADDGAPYAQLWDYGDDPSCTSAVCALYRTARAGRGQTMTLGQALSIGGANIMCAAINGRVADGSSVRVDGDENARSIALLIEHGAFRMLVAGDLTGGLDGSPDVETPLGRFTGSIDILHVNHHGSAASSNAAALALWSPLAAIISVGTDNSYCHPSAQVLQRLEARSVVIFSTGHGITTPSQACPNRTTWPTSARILGTFETTAYQDGSFVIGGERLR